MPLSLAPGVKPVPGYSLVRLLGRGGFGEVWEALAPGGIRVAIKFVRTTAEEAGPEERALKIVSNIRHPHLLDIQFASRVDGYLVIAMPLCEQSLWDRLGECREQGLSGLPYDELIGYMDEMARAVDYLNEPRHDAGDGRRVGVQHRDIKPHNIFLVGGSARLADFGVAKILEGRTGEHTGNMSPHYVAPEVLDGRMCRQTDQYSLALTYCHLRTGRLPFRGESISQVIYAHLHQLADLSGLPEPERNVIARALARDPDDRWPDCRAFVHALAAAGPREESTLPYPSQAHLTATVSPSHLQPAETWAATPPPPSSSSPSPSPSPPSRPADSRTRALYEQTTQPDGGTDSPALPPRRRLMPVRLIGTVVALALVGTLTWILIDVPGPRPKPIPPAPALAPSTALVPRSPVPLPSPLTQSAHKTIEPTLSTESRTLEPAGELAVKAHAILKKHCYQCHGVRFEVPGVNVLDRDDLLAARGEGAMPWLVPGKPDESSLWGRVGIKQDMPPEGSQLADADRALINHWIQAGGAFPRARPVDRPVKGEADLLVAISNYLRPMLPTERSFIRFFTIHNLYNNPSVSDDDLRLARAAVAKLINSLSWKTDVVVPKPIDREQTILAVDLRDIGWDEHDRWFELVSRYPYGLKHDHGPDHDRHALAREAYALANTSMPCIRADWFVARASQPPVYYQLMRIPEKLHEIEETLGVDPNANFLRGKMARAAVTASGVSGQNRLVDRHSARFGAYWKSYDFRSNEGTGNLLRHPLGPVFAGNSYLRQAFEHAGGEVLFSLPNGLHGYVLVDADDRRIDAAPIDIVGDSLKSAGTSAIVAGLSCMACHPHGIVPFQDTVRDGLAVVGAAREKATLLFTEQAELDRLISKDQGRYLAALQEAIAPFLRQGEDREKPIRDFPEPVGAIARAYLKDLGPDDVAAELGLSSSEQLLTTIRANKKLRQLGLGPLLVGDAIKRTDWDGLEGRAISTFQEVSHELGLGIPFLAY